VAPRFASEGLKAIFEHSKFKLIWIIEPRGQADEKEHKEAPTTRLQSLSYRQVNHELVRQMMEVLFHPLFRERVGNVDIDLHLKQGGPAFRRKDLMGLHAIPSRRKKQPDGIYRLWQAVSSLK
jgi:hypothetical protein